LMKGTHNTNEPLVDMIPNTDTTPSRRRFVD
jgi:hypothetical protein